MGQVSYIFVAYLSNTSGTGPREASPVTAWPHLNLSSEHRLVALAQYLGHLLAQISVAGPDWQNWLRGSRMTPNLTKARLAGREDSLY